MNTDIFKRKIVHQILFGNENPMVKPSLHLLFIDDDKNLHTYSCSLCINNNIISKVSAIKIGYKGGKSYDNCINYKYNYSAILNDLDFAITINNDNADKNTRKIEAKSSYHVNDTTTKIFEVEDSSEYEESFFGKNAFIIIIPERANPPYIYQINRYIGYPFTIDYILENMIYDLILSKGPQGYYDSRFSEIYSSEIIKKSYRTNGIMTGENIFKSVENIIKAEEIKADEAGEVIYYYNSDNGIKMIRTYHSDDHKSFSESIYVNDSLIRYIDVLSTDKDITIDISHQNKIIMETTSDKSIDETNSYIIKDIYQKTMVESTYLNGYMINCVQKDNSDYNEHLIMEELAGNIIKYKYDDGSYIDTKKLDNSFVTRYYDNKGILNYTEVVEMDPDTGCTKTNKDVMVPNATPDMGYHSILSIVCQGEESNFETCNYNYYKKITDNVVYFLDNFASFNIDLRTGKVKYSGSIYYIDPKDPVYIRDQFGIPHKYTYNSKIKLWTL